MAQIDKLPTALVEKIAEANIKIGPERALIALQGMVHGKKPLRIIDGVLRSETIDAVNEFLKTATVEDLVIGYQLRLEDRFPGLFEDEDGDDDDPVEEEVVPKTTRRAK